MSDHRDPDERAPLGTGAVPAVLPSPLHSWTLTPREAMRLQAELAPQVEATDRLGTIRTLAGVDVAYGRRGGAAQAAVVALSFPDLVLLEQVRVTRPASFPYVPGLLSFREAPAVLEAFDRLSIRPDLILVDGQGVAHPRRFGIASHLGLWLDLPSIGVAKSRLCGTFAQPGPERGDWTPLRDGEDVLGVVLRSRKNTRPLFISIGHRVSLATAIGVVLASGRGYRLPEPTRMADRLSKQAR